MLRETDPLPVLVTRLTLRRRGWRAKPLGGKGTSWTSGAPYPRSWQARVETATASSILGGAHLAAVPPLLSLSPTRAARGQTFPLAFLFFNTLTSNRRLAYYTVHRDANMPTMEEVVSSVVLKLPGLLPHTLIDGY